MLCVKVLVYSLSKVFRTAKVPDKYLKVKNNFYQAHLSGSKNRALFMTDLTEIKFDYANLACKEGRHGAQ